jgi:hypothetical protein
VSFKSAYVVVRVTPEGVVSVAHTANTIKDARYWLQYIAEPGDAVFQTPAHPKYAGGGDLKYQSHLVKRGEIVYDEAKWKKQVAPNGNVQLPTAEA